MKVLFISNHRNASGWSEQARNSILAMDAAGIEVVPRHIEILNNQGEIPARIIELEKNSSKNPDIIFQNVLPSMAEYHTKTTWLDNNKTGYEFIKKIPIMDYKNILFYVTESSGFKASGWQHRANLFDQIINCCFWNKEVGKKSGITKPIHIVPQAIDLEKSKKEWPVHEIKKMFKDEFIFYTIGELTTRKNTEQLIRAFHTEFKPTEQVQLVIKTTPQGLGGNPLQELQNRVNNIKMGLKLYRNIESYKREILMVGQTSEEEIYSLHQSFDCFVSASHAESFCIPAAVAMSMGKILIVPFYGGFTQYCNLDNSYMIFGQEDYIHSATDQMADLYTAHEKWFYPSTNHIQVAMRSAFENHNLNRKRLEQAKKDIQKLSYENIGKEYLKVLNVN